MPGSKRQPRPTNPDVLDEPWTDPQGTENEIKRQHRKLLPPGFPDDLSRSSQPDTGSLGDAGRVPVANRKPPFTLKKGGR